MTRPGDGKVSVHVDVVIDGDRVYSSHQPGVTESRAGLQLKPLQIVYPPSNTPVPVTACGGTYCVPANGNAPPFVFPPVAAKALCYNTTTPFPNNVPPLLPPDAAVPGTVNLDGSWSFTAVPGATCDNNGSGPNNSTLVVWYDFGLVILWPTDVTPFHGICPGGSGSGSCPAVAAIAAHPKIKARTLHAGFTRGLARLGNVVLQWNGVSWVGQTAGHGGCILSFQCSDSACQLQAAGPGAAFIVAGRPNSYKPFHWSGTGAAFGALAGDFAVQITE